MPAVGIHTRATLPRQPGTLAERPGSPRIRLKGASSWRKAALDRRCGYAHLCRHVRIAGVTEKSARRPNHHRPELAVSTETTGALCKRSSTAPVDGSTGRDLRCLARLDRAFRGDGFRTPRRAYPRATSTEVSMLRQQVLGGASSTHDVPRTQTTVRRGPPVQNQCYRSRGCCLPNDWR